MESLLQDILIGIGAAGGTMGIIKYFKSSKPEVPPPKPNHDGIPLIEIDGKLVPHPTVVARRQKRLEQLNSGR